MKKEFEKREGISRRRKYALLTLGVLGTAAVLGAYFNFYVPQQKRSQRLQQLIQAGLTEDQASSFESIFQ